MIKEFTGAKTIDLGQLAKNVQEAAVDAKTVAPLTVIDKPGTCTDCAGKSPTPAGTPVLKDTWFEVNLPNQGDPTIQQQIDAEAAKRKTLMTWAGIILLLLILGIFMVKQFKKS